MGSSFRHRLHHPPSKPLKRFMHHLLHHVTHRLAPPFHKLLILHMHRLCTTLHRTTPLYPLYAARPCGSARKRNEGIIRTRKQEASP
jgi:hypothetical protein